MCLTFSVTLKDMFGEAVEFDLCKDGRERAVDGLNKFQFVELYADFLLNKSIDKSVMNKVLFIFLHMTFKFNAFRKGFFLVTQRSPLRALFRPEELEAIVIGQREYDWEELQENCEYDGGFSADHTSIKLVRSRISYTCSKCPSSGRSSTRWTIPRGASFWSSTRDLTKCQSVVWPD